MSSNLFGNTKEKDHILLSVIAFVQEGIISRGSTARTRYSCYSIQQPIFTNIKDSAILVLLEKRKETGILQEPPSYVPAQAPELCANKMLWRKCTRYRLKLPPKIVDEANKLTSSQYASEQYWPLSSKSMRTRNAKRRVLSHPTSKS